MESDSVILCWLGYVPLSYIGCESWLTLLYLVWVGSKDLTGVHVETPPINVGQGHTGVISNDWPQPFKEIGRASSIYYYEGVWPSEPIIFCPLLFGTSICVGHIDLPSSLNPHKLNFSSRLLSLDTNRDPRTRNHHQNWQGMSFFIFFFSFLLLCHTLTLGAYAVDGRAGTSWKKEIQLSSTYCWRESRLPSHMWHNAIRWRGG